MHHLFLFPFFLLTLSLASDIPEEPSLQETCIWRQTILDGLSHWEELDSFPIKSIQETVYGLLGSQLREIKSLNGNAVTIVLHPTNYNYFTEGGLSLCGIKSKLWPKSSFSSINQTEITEQMQEKIIDLMDINKVADFLMKSQRVVDAKYAISKAINNYEYIQNMINKQLFDIPRSSSRFLGILLGPVNEKLILSYRPDCDLTLSEHVKSQLCPDGFFSFKFAEIELSKKLRHKIFRLLSWEKIFNVLTDHEPELNQNMGLVDIFNKEEILESLHEVALCDQDANMELLEGLAKVDQSYKWFKYLTAGVMSYDELCKAIRELITRQKLKRKVQRKSLKLLCPSTFFNIPGVEVPEKRRKKIFKLLEFEEIVQVLAKDDDSLKHDCDIDQIINKDEILKRLCDIIINSNYSRSIAAEILAKTDQLNKLPDYLENKSIFNYEEFCELIQKKLLGSESD